MNERLEHLGETVRKRLPYIILFLLGLWLAFGDRDSVFYQLKISGEIKALEAENARLREKIKKTREQLQKMDEPEYLEKFAREELLLHKKNEDIYIIDSVENE